MEIAKFVITAVGTFISVSGLTFTIFTFWLKRRDEKDTAFKNAIRKDMEEDHKETLEAVAHERHDRETADAALTKRIDVLERNLMENLQQRIGNIEGQLKGMSGTLKAIEMWFINNTPTGGK